MPTEVLSAPTRADRVLSNLTTNATSGVFRVPSGPKSFYGEVVGTGAVTQTIAIYGTPYNTATNGVLLGTLTLSGTTRDQDALAVMTGWFPYFYAITTNTTGTDATGALYAMY